MKKYILITLFYICPALTHAQGWTWANISTGAGTDSWAVATDHAGNVYGGGVISGGIYDSIVHFGGDSITGTSDMNAFWVKYSNSGSVDWAHCVSGAKTAYSWLNNLTTDPSGNLIVFGSFSGDSIKIGPYTLTNAHGGAAAQYFLAKINSSGTVLWAINDGYVSDFIWTDILGVYIMSLGGVATDTAGNIYITSTFSKPAMSIGAYTLTNANSAGGTNDIFVAKYSPAGSLLWATSIGGKKSDYSFGMTVAATGNVYITGAFFSDTIRCGPSVITNPPVSFSPTPHGYLAEFSASGTPLWAQGMGGPWGAYGIGLTSDDRGNIYLAGTFEDTSVSFGATTLTRTYPASVPNDALFLVQYSAIDSIVWAKTIGAQHGQVYGFSIALARCGEVWVSGNYNDTVTIDSNTLALVPGPDPIFIAGYDLYGRVLSQTGLGSGADDQNGIACDDSGNVFIVSDYKSYPFTPYYFTVGADTFPPADGGSFPGGESFYIAKYKAFLVPDTSYVVNITTNNINGDTVCFAYPDTFIAHTNIPVGLYLWYVNGILVGSGDSIFSYPPTGNDTIFCSVSGNPCVPSGFSDTSNKIILNVINDQGDFILISASPQGTLCKGDSVTFTCTTYLGGRLPTYAWKLNGVTVGTGTTWSYVPSNGDSVWCDLTSSYPCLSASAAHSNRVVMNVNNCREQASFIARILTNIYPSPAARELTIQTNPITYPSFTITNSLGQLMMQQPLNGAITQVDISALPAGTYYISLKGFNGNVVRKFVKI